ncbi:TIGR04013 family B12-binding domain/radical SAM domain-containing protein [Methanosarcina sp. WWM596]|uniref:TIGR04013 family B12-binding domain/radical SAM domain-containing protein n=1 Tax=Methanosarcina sp. WWM596 TaxID=1434103 RepID=UPI000615DFF1|nr:TIGR04013 family B12-binding domain/radical SAM domain-containing protein [Methanosarcina sp. WWM596]AKB17031.1 (dimethylallyl)adenosine tRNA methylthiotransferase [Methanosarcina sp. WWM596]
MDVHFRYSKKNSYSFAVLSPLLPEAGFTDSPLNGIMIYSFTTRQAAKVFMEVENAGTDSIFIAGGPHPSGSPEETLEYFDYVVIGEGEETLPELVKVLKEKGEPGEVKGIAYKSDTGRIIITPERKHVDLDAYLCFDPKKLRSPIEISRGCPWGCKYCQTPRLFGREVRHRSIDCILKNAQHYDDLRFIASNAFAYGSDGIHPRFDKVEKLLSALHELPDKKIFFGTFPSEVRPEFVTEESAELVRKYCANDSLSMGVQSGSDRILKEIRRGHTVEDSISAIECCFEHEIVPAVDFIFGLPTETEEDQEKSLDLVRWICRKGGTVRAHYLTPLPGTPYVSAVPSEVSAHVRRELGKLALGGKLTGYWEKHRKV